MRLFNKKFLWIGFAGVIAGFMFLSGQASNQPQSFDEDRLIASALHEAQFSGLQLSGDSEQDRQLVQLTAYTTLEEWNSSRGTTLAATATRFGLNPDMQIFVVVIRGEVFSDQALGLPQPGQLKGAVYDNIYVLVNPDNEEVVGTTSFNIGQRLPLYSSETFASGATAVIKLIESTAELIPSP